MIYKSLIILSISFLATSFVYGQNKFSISIHFPNQIKDQEVELSYDNGRTIKKVPFLLNNHTISVSGSFYSKYATIYVQIDSNRFKLPRFSSFFVKEKPASITFHERRHANSKSKSFTLVNAYDIGKISKSLDKYTAPERQAFEDFQAETSVNDSSYILNQILVRRWINKKLEFIKHHKDEYFSFWLFRTNIAPNIFINPDSLLNFYRTNFSVNIRNTSEGKEILEILNGRKIATSENMLAPKFNVTDIYGNRIRSQNLKGKYVLINFWASWCIPCVDELPAIKKISDQYFPVKLVIITNTSDADSSAFLSALKKYGMTSWSNIYRDFAFTKKFGGVSAIPQLFLINPNGKIIYNRNFKETNYEKLTRLNQILKEKLK